MAYIRQKGTAGGIETIVNLTGYTGVLTAHPCLIEHPELFEVVDGDAPTAAFQILNYAVSQ